MAAPDKSPLIYVDLYQGPAVNSIKALFRARPQRWRWRAINGDNGRVLGISSEAYTNRGDALAAVKQLFGSNSDVYLRGSDQGNELLRLSDLHTN